MCKKSQQKGKRGRNLGWSVKKFPSTIGAQAKSKKPFDIEDPACNMSSCRANVRDRSKADDLELKDQGDKATPDCKTKRLKRVLDKGENACKLTLSAPALSPNKVRDPGSPLNFSMFRLVHFSAADWSSMPMLPGTSGMPRLDIPERQLGLAKHSELSISQIYL
uniref:Uncharacterized protein n=1 Tax=Romanomermis culicivorax TaxID=13658 RepID=A0A915KTC9_ROMCU